MKAVFLITMLVLCTSCATIGLQEHTYALKQALKDDLTCQTQGWHYPEPRYVTCRMQLDDQRQYRDWMNLQIMSQSRYQNPSAVPAVLPREIYRPLDRDRYQCRYVSENSQDYILCGETPKKN